LAEEEEDVKEAEALDADMKVDGGGGDSEEDDVELEIESEEEEEERVDGEMYGVPEQGDNSTEETEEVTAVEPPFKKVLTKKALEKARRTQEKRGVVYLGSIPPHMKPMKMRQLLSPFGALDRMYLTPEDPSVRLRRKRFGGNTGKNFTEGWVEFRDKAQARATAQMLNGNAIGGKRRSAYYSDLWNIRYLPKFKWDNLVEEIEFQKALREQKMQLELAVAKKERDFYLQKVEQSKQIQKMQQRRETESGAGSGGNDGPPLDREETKDEYDARAAREKQLRREDRNALLRRFKQRTRIGDFNVDDARGMLAPDLLRDIFSGSSAQQGA